VRGGALPRSAAADHGVDISDARIPKISFVVTAIKPARCSQTNQMNPSILSRSAEFPSIALKRRSNGRTILPSLIASHSQLEEGKVGDTVECHRLVTRAQHNRMKAVSIGALGDRSGRRNYQRLIKGFPNREGAKSRAAAIYVFIG
jgi:hypothetical protein